MLKIQNSGCLPEQGKKPRVAKCIGGTADTLQATSSSFITSSLTPEAIEGSDTDVQRIKRR